MLLTPRPHPPALSRVVMPAVDCPYCNQLISFLSDIMKIILTNGQLLPKPTISQLCVQLKKAPLSLYSATLILLHLRPSLSSREFLPVLIVDSFSRVFFDRKLPLLAADRLLNSLNILCVFG
jgi:hypothetical protein